MDVNHDEAVSVLKQNYDKKVPVFLWGAPGIGKSSLLRQVTNELKIGLIDTRISQLDPSDLRGLPSIHEETTKWLIPSWFPREGKGIWFLDELNLAPPSIQASAYQLILDRKIGAYELPDGWVVFAAGNRTEDHASVFDMPAPLANRLAHITLRTPTPETWTEWALENRLDSRIVAFINWKPILLFKFDPKANEKAFPTPRSLEMASKLIGGVHDLNFLRILVGSCAGEGFGTEFVAFTQLSEQVDLESILKNPELAKTIERPDLKYTMVSGLAEKYREKTTRDISDKLLEISIVIEPEFGMLLNRMFKSVCENDEDYKNTVLKSRHKEQWLKKFSKFLL